MPRRRLRIALALGLMVLLANPLQALDLPRGTLWRVVQTCVLNQTVTGSPFPCLAVDLAGGTAVLRAPFRQTHVVTMPTARVTGVEDAALWRTGQPNYFAAAWQARRFVEAELKRPVDRTDLGLAVNSRLTRSQDQLHVHVDCIAARARAAVAKALPSLRDDAWTPDAVQVYGQRYAGRIVPGATLVGTDVFGLAGEVPAIKAHHARATIAVLGVTLPDGKPGFVLLAGESNPRRASLQSTAEDLLDHSCARPS